MDQLEFGASLYVPATRKNLTEIGKGHSIAGLRSVIFCTEDSLLEEEIPLALDNLATALRHLAAHDSKGQPSPLRLVRPRSPEVLQKILAMEGVQALCGFVLPKFSLHSMQGWLRIMAEHPRFICMPTLETEDTFDATAMQQLRDALLTSPHKKQVALLRIGGLDLLNLLGIRRHCQRTIYDTALRHCLQQLACIFLPSGFMLSAPAFECMGHHDVLRAEVEMDILHGFHLKSAIHPDQICVLHEAYKVPAMDVQVATALLNPQSPAIFRMDNRMCEKKTHVNWAQHVLRRAQLYGTLEENFSL